MTQNVSATSAGSVLTCECGAAIHVPRLSELRRSAGQSAIPLDAVQRVAVMINNGELPTEQPCPISGRRADRTAMLHIECERASAVGGDSNNLGMFMLSILFGPLIGILSSERRKHKDHGRDRSIVVPLKVSSEFLPELKRMRAKKLRRLLLQVPAYADLFKEFPLATASLSSVSDD